MTYLRTSLVFACLLLWTQQAIGETRPDVVLIMVDDLRPWLGCYGYANLKTPNIDRLADRGVVFERAYCQYAKCGPSRASLMAGQRPDTTGVYSHGKKDLIAFRSRKTDAVSLPAWMKQHGYQALNFGKIDHDGWQVAEDWSAPPMPGREKEILEIVDPGAPTGPTVIADRFNCPAIQSPDVSDETLFAGRMTGQVIASLESRSTEQPLFLAVGYRRPHLPLVAPKSYFDLYSVDDSWLASNQDPAKDSPVFAWLNSLTYAKSATAKGFNMPMNPSRAEGVLWSGYELRSYVGVPNYGEIPDDTQRQILQAYAACVSYIDAQIGKLLDQIDLEKTVVLLCSDHGWHLGEQSAWAKMTNFEVATRVPLIVSAPGIAAGRSEMLAELVDLYPSICELAGIPLPSHLDGESLVGELRSPGASPQQTYALSQIFRKKEAVMGRAIRTDRYRFVLWTKPNSNAVVARELYDHRVDPDETKNLAADSESADVVAKLESRLRRAYGKRGTSP